jgi:hypothetical protein
MKLVGVLSIILEVFLTCHGSNQPLFSDRNISPRRCPKSQMKFMVLRGGGGAVFDGGLVDAPGLPSVSETLSLRGALGGTCGDPANIPCDITSNNHLDMLMSPKAFSILGTPAVDVPEPELNIPELKAQGDNFYRAHVSRGAAILSEGSGDRLLMARALMRHFDSDGDGFLQRPDLQNLLNKTREYEDEVPLELDANVWMQIMNETNSDPAQGLDTAGLLAIYDLPEEDLREDFIKIFGSSIRSLKQLPIPLHPCPDPFDGEPDPLLGRLRDPILASQLRRWQLECSFVKPSADLWDRKLPEDCVDARPELYWHEWDWAEHDHRVLRDFLFELSLEADVKQRPTQAEAPYLPSPPPLCPPTTRLPITPGPLHIYGLTWPEYMARLAREAPTYTDFRFYPNPSPPGPPPHHPWPLTTSSRHVPASPPLLEGFTTGGGPALTGGGPALTCPPHGATACAAAGAPADNAAPAPATDYPPSAVAAAAIPPPPPPPPPPDEIPPPPPVSDAAEFVLPPPPPSETGDMPPPPPPTESESECAPPPPPPLVPPPDICAEGPAPAEPEDGAEDEGRAQPEAPTVPPEVRPGGRACCLCGV